MAWQTTTAQDIINYARAAIGEYNVEGVPISSDTGYMKTLQTDGLQFLNMGLKKVFNKSKTVKTFDIDATANTTDEIYTIYTMPDDFGGFDDIINLTRGEVIDYKWVGFNKLYMRNTYLGEATLVYNVFPTEITALTDLVNVPNAKAIEFLNNFVASRLALKFNPGVSDFYSREADELLFDILPIQPADEEPIEDSNRGYNYGSHWYY